MLQLAGNIAEVEPEIRLDPGRIFHAPKNTKVLFRQQIILVVIIFDAEPFHHFRRNIGVATGGEKCINLAGGDLTITQIVVS
jgi:hypothetical protein